MNDLFKNDLLNFTSRQTYMLKQRAWSARYQELVLGIRSQKQVFKNAQRKQAWLHPYKEERELNRLREEIVELGSLRYDMKRKAEAQYVPRIS